MFFCVFGIPTKSKLGVINGVDQLWAWFRHAASAHGSEVRKLNLVGNSGRVFKQQVPEWHLC